MVRLLYRPNVSWDFGYAIKEAAYALRQEAAEADPASRREELTLDERIRSSGIGEVPPQSVTGLAELEAAPRLELSNWDHDRARAECAGYSSLIRDAIPPSVG